MQSGVTESKRGGKAMERLLAQLASKQGLCLQSKDNLQKTLIQIKHVLKNTLPEAQRTQGIESIT